MWIGKNHTPQALYIAWYHVFSEYLFGHEHHARSTTFDLVWKNKGEGVCNHITFCESTYDLIFKTWLNQLHGVIYSGFWENVQIVHESTSPLKWIMVWKVHFLPRHLVFWNHGILPPPRVTHTHTYEVVVEKCVARRVGETSSCSEPQRLREHQISIVKAVGSSMTEHRSKPAFIFIPSKLPNFCELRTCTNVIDSDETK